MSKTDQYLVEANPDFGHGYMHIDALVRSGGDLITAFYANLWGLEDMTREEKVAQFPHKHTNSLGQEIPLHPELYSVYTALKAALPWVDIAPIADRVVDNSRAHRWATNASDGFLSRTGFLRAAVYCPGDAYAMGVVTVDRETTEGKTLYVLNAPGIVNPRFKYTSTNYNSVRAESIDKLVANCKKHLRPYTPVDAAILSRKLLGMHLNHKFNAAANIYNQAVRKFHKANDIAKLVNVVNRVMTGATAGITIDSDVRNGVIDFIAAKSVFDEEKNRKHYATYVQIRTRGEHTDASMVPMVYGLHDTEYTDDFTFTMPDHPRVWMDVDKLPDEVTNKISALSMLTKGEYVEGLGIKTSDSEYWVTNDTAPETTELGLPQADTNSTEG